MSQWKNKVRLALKDQRVLDGIAMVATSWMSDHIENNFGRGKGGSKVNHVPLKSVRGTYLSSTKPRGATATRVRKSYMDAKGRIRVKTMYLVESTSYRSGGQPLVDTGALANSLSSTAKTKNSAINITLRGKKYGIYQDRGFKTKGPNFIPLTKKGRRGHATGANPMGEGLVRGKDFTMAWKGVTVPSRPFLLPLRSDLRTLGKSIYMGLKTVLKGK